MSRLRTVLDPATPAPPVTAGSLGHTPDHEQLARIARNVAYATGDYSMDKYAGSDNTSLLATAMSELDTAGGGTLMLDDNGIYLGDVEVPGGVSLKGRGLRSRIQGVGRAKPIVKKLGNGEGCSVEDLQIIGTRTIAGLPDGPLPDGISDPEIGYYDNNFGGYTRRVYVFNSKGPGVYRDKGGGHIDSLQTFWTGGPGYWLSPGTGYDNRLSNLYVGPCFSAAGIITGAGGCIWTNCRSFGQGSHIVGGQIKWDPANRTVAAWSLGGEGHMFNGIYGDDSPIAFLVQRGGNIGSLFSAGCLMPIFLNFINPDGTDGDNLFNLMVSCQDRFTPRCAVDAYLPWGTKVTSHILWESATIPSSQGMNVGTKIRDYVDPEQGAFKAVHLSGLSSGTPTLYNRNEYRVNGEEAWKAHNVTTNGATLTPDLADAFNYVVTLNGNLTIAKLVNRGALAAGRPIRFIFIRPAGTVYTVTWDASWKSAPQPSAGAGQTSMIEFVNFDGLFAQGPLGANPDIRFRTQIL